MSSYFFIATLQVSNSPVLASFKNLLFILIHLGSLKISYQKMLSPACIKLCYGSRKNL